MMGTAIESIKGTQSHTGGRNYEQFQRRKQTQHFNCCIKGKNVPLSADPPSNVTTPIVQINIELPTTILISLRQVAGQSM